MQRQKRTSRNPWVWVPSLYFAEGIPYVIVMTLSVIFYKRMGISNADIALYTSWLYLPWTIKPLWSPLVDILKTRRWWIVIMQLLIGVGLAGVALTIPVPDFFRYTLAFFWLLAFSSATHDIAADGFYLLGLSKHNQAYYIGIRSTFYRLAMLTGQGLLVILAGYFEAGTGLPKIDISVQAGSGYPTQIFEPSTMEIHSDSLEMYFLCEEEVNVKLENIENRDAENLLRAIDEWNIRQGFYQTEDDITLKPGESSWWQNHVSGPLAERLKRAFRADVPAAVPGKAGNIGYTWFYLSQKPAKNRNIVLSVSHSRGDKSIALAKAYRFEFSEENWNKPAYVAFQLDPKLDTRSSAIFTTRSGNISFAWMMVFGVIAVVFLIFFVYHKIILPLPPEDKPNRTEGESVFKEFIRTFAEFFRKKEIGVILIFLLVYRLGESQLVKLASPFLLDSREKMGLGLTTGEIGIIYGTIGIIALSLGGIIGGIAASRKGLKYWIWWMVAAMNLPNLVYVFLSYTMPESLWIVGVSVAVEQFGYGFGFTAYMLYMIYVSEGEHKTAHFAITTGFMALGMMIPGMISGWLQEIIGYQNFFVWVIICTIPSFLIIPFVKIDKKFGVKTNNH